MKYKAKYIGPEGMCGDIKQGDIVEVEPTSVNVRDSTGNIFTSSAFDFEKLEEEKQKSGLREVIGQDMKSINVEFK